ncbi:MAG: NADH-quinone oxidoreductase subunit M [Actinomycetota bacterium]|nr:NADH-quinone oxidoreductase subunit M [Actinomycetota bacterium]
MEWVEDWGLSLGTFLPLLGAIVLMFVPSDRDRLLKIIATVFAGLALLAGILVAVQFDYSNSGQLQQQVNAEWIPQIDSNYHIGIDGISLPLFVLSLLVSFLCMIYLWWHVPSPGKPKALLALVLLLETGMNGSFIALDLILFFVFWELVLVPMYFMIGIWGGPRREYASVKFFLYTLFGSLFMLLGFLAMYLHSGTNGGDRTFDMVALAEQGINASSFTQNLIFLGLFLGFAVKVPMWPFHTWLPDAHTEAPTVGSVLLAAIMLKMGTYGFVRISLPILPESAVDFAPIIGILAVIAIIYGALCCLAQSDLKRLIAFSSVGHMGFVMLGISTLTQNGINAAIFGMVAHGLITGMLFFLAGSIHERYHTREISELGGVLQQIPRFGSLLTYTAIASLGLPGLAGFWGEFLALLAAYQPHPELSETLFRVLMVGGGIGTVLTAGYFLWMLQRVNLGRPREKFAEGHGIFDVQRLEWLAWAPLLFLILFAGLFPKLVLDVTDDAVNFVTSAFGG